MMKKTVLLLMLCCCATTILAQTSARDEIKANPYLAGSNYLDYDRQLPPRNYAPTPRGYEAFYLTHYGRHGSRWLLGDNDYSSIIKVLRKAENQNKLTAKGRETLRQLEAFYPTTINRLGDLTTVGERQHHGIGRRMAENFPSIFKTKNLAIDARSTVVNRCILSMVAECEELMAANPTARIHNDVSESLQYYLNQRRTGLVRENAGKGRDERRQFRDKHTHPERLSSVLFNDQQWVRDSIDAASLMRHLFEVAINMQSHDTDIDLMPLFTNDELYEQWLWHNVDWYVDYGASPLTGGYMPFSQRNLLRNIIETADTVLKSGNKQATLRFGHEVCVMPLACLMELDSCGISVADFDELEYRWQNYRIYPMACNIQLIFYRPKKKGATSDVLVKAMLNEREATLPIPTTQHPYYRWDDLRAYWTGRLDRFDALNEAAENKK